MERLIFRYEVACAELIKPYQELQNKYEDNLEQLLDTVTRAGALEKVLAVRAEIEGFREGKTEPAGAEFPELPRLQGIFARAGAERLAAMEAQAAPLTEDHQKRLGALVKELTRQQRLEEALAVNRALGEVSARATLLALIGAKPPRMEDEAMAVEEGSGAPTDAATAGETAANPATASRESPFVNTLGMRFVPVPITGGPSEGERVLFSVWETRVSDYQRFLRDNPDRKWSPPNFDQGDDHPVVMVSWEDATAFCEWLTEEERKKGKIGARDRHRLPTDHEWSCAIGIGEKEDPDQTPAAKNNVKLGQIYPWGKEWPPPAGSGNYRWEETWSNPVGDGKVIVGYNDGHKRTAPVGSFSLEHFGIRDLSGNVWEWCQDWRNDAKEKRVLRGGSWNNGGERNLLSSYRISDAPTARREYGGFRCVLEVVSAG